MAVLAGVLWVVSLAGCAAGTQIGHEPVTPLQPASRHDDFEQPRVVCDWVVDSFQSSPLGAFPEGWAVRDEGQLPLAQQRGAYQVEMLDGQRVLHARYVGEAITIGRPVPGWDLAQYPILEWRWKAVTLPEGANEAELSTNDSAASVYVVWKIGLPFMIDGIRYTWSSSLLPGTHISRRFGHDHVLVVQSGASDGWHTERVDVGRHHQRFLDEDEPRPPAGIALLSDADATGSAAEAYFADFKLCRRVPRTPRGKPQPQP